MGTTIQKQSIRGLIYSYFGVALGFVITGFLMPHIFNAEQIGLLRVLVSYSSLMAQIAGLGFSVVAVRMFPYFKDQRSRHHGFFGLYLLVGIVGFTLTTIVYLLLKETILASSEEKSNLFLNYFYYVLPITFSTMLYLVVDTYYRVLQNATKGILYKEVIQRGFIICVIGLYHFQFATFHQSVFWYSLALCLPGFLMILPLFRSKQVSLKPDYVFFSGKIRKQMVSVALFGILTSLAGGLVINVDILMVQQYLGLHDTGIYGITFFFGTLVLIPSRPVIKISSVFVAEAFKNNDVDRVHDIYKKSSINLGVIGLLILIGIWANIDNVFHLITEDFRPGEYVILLIAAANIIDMFMALSMQIITNSSYYKLATYSQFLFVLFLIVSNIYFIPLYGITGAALATLVSKFAFNLVKFLIILYKIGIQPFSYKTLVLLVIAVVTLLLANQIPAFSNFIVDIIIRSLLIVVFYFSAILIFRVSNEVNQKFKDVLKRFEQVN